MVEPYDVNRLNRVPTFSEYSTAKKEYEIGVDKSGWRRSFC